MAKKVEIKSGQFLYLGELAAAILMFAGFQAASRPEVKEEVVSSMAMASAD